MTRTFALAVLFGSCLILGGCGKDEPPRQSSLPPGPNEAPGPATPDRLPPGELLEGEARAFGIAIPRQMTLESVNKQTAHARGPVAPEALGEYLRARVLAQHVEMAEKRLIFPKVHVRGDDKRTVLRLEIIDDGLSTHLVLRNLTGPPPIPGLSDEERWKRAGLRPGGQLIDPQKAE